MTKPLAYGTLLLLSSSLVAPAALAQDAPAPAPQEAPAQEAPQDQPAEEEVEISAPGSDAGEEIVIVGRNIPNVIRATPQVVSVLSTEDIARTGEGDIAGALTRVTGLSVVGGGFVFVRGLGDRYSSALLNGSPLPSPEPLRRTVPLDIFPTSIVGSAVVQKSYSANYAGEFGGGVINLTTRAIPKESFLNVGFSAGYDSATTGQFGYVYDGGSQDWIGYDSGERAVPGFIRDIGLNGQFVSTEQVAQLSNAPTALVQENNDLPANYSGEISFAHVVDVGSDRFGVIGSVNFANSFRTRDAIQQDTVDTTGALRNDFRTVLTDNRIVLNGLLGLGYEFDDHKIRWTNVYIHDTVKQARGSAATLYTNTDGSLIFQQNTSWFERQLFDTQFVGEFKFDDLTVDVRGTYANSKRNSPYERFFSYNFRADLGLYVNGLRNAPREAATIAFSELDEDLWSGQIDLGYQFDIGIPVTASAGYYYSDSDRVSSRFAFSYTTNTNSQLLAPFSYLRPDLMFSRDILFSACPSINDGIGPGCIRLLNNTGPQGAGEYLGNLRIHAGYGQLEAELADGLRATVGVRYEDAILSVLTNTPNFPGATNVNDHWLPAATVTWNFAEDMQFRLHGSKTIARPQFRELAPQFYQDFESDRLFFGNPGLVDTILWNYEARYEWFFGRNQRITAAAFYKDITNPIEQVSSYGASLDSRIQTGFSYAPAATLYGGEIEVQKYIPLEGLGGSFFASRRLLLIANYTYTKSELQIGTELVPDSLARNPDGTPQLRPANAIYRDGVPLTGQSDHLVNVQVGIEDTDKLSQLTVLFNYASDRVTARGASNLSGVGFLPDVVERPGIRLDVVARQGITLLGKEFELKFEARNLTGTQYQEFQDFGGGNRVFINRWNQGRIFTLGFTAKL